MWGSQMGVRGDVGTGAAICRLLCRGAGAGPQGSPSAGRAWGRPEAAPYGRRRRPALRAVLLHGLAESAPPGQQKSRPGIAAEAGV